MVKYYIIIFLVSVGCGNKKSDGNNTKLDVSEADIIMRETKDTLMFKDLSYLAKKEAIQKYGEPINEEVGELHNMQGEFYTELENTVTGKDREKKIIIHELTWDKDSISFITVWYEQKADVFTPRAILTWRKDVEF